MKYVLLAIIVLLFSFISCQDDNGTGQLKCDLSARISKAEYPTAPDDPVEILDFSINKNCLIFSYSATGCNGNSWALELIDSGEVAESQPPRRNIVFVLHNDETCENNVTGETSFDVSPLKVEGNNSVYLVLQNTGEEILYEY
jgi:hypothetical protein